MEGSLASLDLSDKISLSDGNVSREENEKLGRVLLGELSNLPSLSSRIVRIFTSSTFTDTTLERNALMEKVYPQIKEFCRETHGLEFQVVDMRWGIRDEATDDHMTTELCMQEIENCQRLSMGPNFVVFLGQKYGYRPLPAIVAAKEFELLRECVRNIPSELELLEEWYKKDHNSVPPVYVLQPISSIFTNFNNKRNQRLQESDQASWWETFGKLQRIIRKAAQVLFYTKKLDREQMHNYFMSVTEREIERGILKASNVDDHCLCYIREITNINTTLLRFAGKFVDFAARNVDGEAQKLLKTLRDDKLPKKLANTNLTRFSVEWSGKEGIDIETHAEYLEAFCNHFFSSVSTLVNNAMAKHEKLANNAVYVETLQHLNACQMFCKVFQGREDTVQRIHHYITDHTDRPFVLYGESGCGKTSLMAKGSSQVRSWLPDGVYPVLMLRFLGTTPHSSSIIPLLISLCKQLAFVYDQPEAEVPEELAPLIQHFKKLMACASAEKPLVIFLDSLDQLSGADGAHQLAWIPIQLPPYVKMVVSTLPNYYNLLNTLQKMIESEASFVQILPLGENLSSTILKLWLKNANKAITEQQWTVVNEAIAKCNLPLFVKLVFDEICRWRSYTSPKMTTLAFTIHDSIMKLFERIENQHGKTLVSHALGYITAAKNGLSEPELEDLLSMDEKVLNDVYQYHLPPVRRIPPLLWTRLRNDLPGYLSEREAEGVNVIGWYHRQFIDAAKERYFKNLNFVSEIHFTIAEYFLGTWGGGVGKPFEYSELQRQRFQLEERTGESDRKLPAQQLKFGDADGKTMRYNLRKLSELPFHLVRSHRFECLFTEVLFNYKFLHAKISSMPLQALLADFEDFMTNVYDKDAKLLADALRLSSSILSHYPDMLGPQIVGRLLPHYGSNQKIKVLIDQCDTDGLLDCALVPSHHCLHTPGGPLQYSLEGHPFAPFGIGVTSDAKYLVSVSNKFIIWDTCTGEVFRTVTPGIGGIMQNLLITPDDKHAVSFTNNNQILVCNILTGDYHLISDPLDKKLGDIIGISVTNTLLIAWSDKEWAMYYLSGKCAERQKVANDKVPLINVQLGDDAGKKKYFSLKSGLQNDDDLALEVQGEDIEPFEYHSALVMTKDKQTCFSCIEISDHAVVVYKLSENTWKYDRTLGDNVDEVFSLRLSEDEKYLVATLALGFKLWDLRTDVMRQLRLPHGIRNIPTRNQLTNHVVFTKNNHFIVAGVRKNLYVWDVKQGNLVKTLDAHFGRIIALTSVIRDINTVISSSMDKTIKVWNFNNILEDVFSIDRHDKPIETLHLATNAYKGVTTTRNCIGIWNLENGKLLKTLGTSAHSSIIINALITADGEHVIAAETMTVVVWDVEKEKAVASLSQKDVQQVILCEEDTKFLTLSKSALNKGKCVYRTIPEGEEIYQFEYNLKTFRNGVVSCNGLFIVLPAVDKSGDVLDIFHAKTGTRLYKVQLKFSSYKEIGRLVAMPHDPNQVAIIDSEKGNIIDLKKKSFIRSVPKWNGMCTQNGKVGLYAPNRGGMDLIELKHGKTVLTLIPRIAEGVFKVAVKFTKTDQHVLYYHSGHRTIRVFRTSDGKMIANFKTQAAVKVMEGSAGGASVVLGCEDGSLTVLTIADPTSESSVEFLKSLPSRQFIYTSGSPSRKGCKGTNGDVANGRMSVGTALQMARFVAKARGVQKSRACVLS